MTSPTKPKTDDLHRVAHGGGWNYDDATLVRAAFRIGGAPASRYSYVGFRCAQRGAKMPVGKGTP